MGEEKRRKLSVEFYLEASLHNLAKWLRFFGYKAWICEKKLNLEEILKHRDKIFIVTSEETARMLEKIGVKYLLIPRHDFKAQLNFLINRLNINPELKLNICSVCGHELVEVSKEEVKELVPPRVFKLYDRFCLCPGCNRVYWQGDHIKRLKNKLKKILSRRDR